MPGAVRFHSAPSTATSTARSTAHSTARSTALTLPSVTRGRYENYHWVPSKGQWVNYYSGRLPAGGTLTIRHAEILQHEGLQDVRQG